MCHDSFEIFIANTNVKLFFHCENFKVKIIYGD